MEQLRKEILALMKLNESLQGDIKALQKTNKDLANEGSSVCGSFRACRVLLLAVNRMMR